MIKSDMIPKVLRVKTPSSRSSSLNHEHRILSLSYNNQDPNDRFEHHGKFVCNREESSIRMNLISHLVKGTWPINCENHWKSRYPYINVKYSNIFVNVGVPSWVEVSQVFVAGSKVYLYVFPPVERELFTDTHFLHTTFPLYAWRQEPMNSCVPMSRKMTYLSIGIVLRHIKWPNISQIVLLHWVDMLPCKSGKRLGWGRLLYWLWAATTPSQPRPWLRPTTCVLRRASIQATNVHCRFYCYCRCYCWSRIMSCAGSACTSLSCWHYRSGKLRTRSFLSS